MFSAVSAAVGVSQNTNLNRKPIEKKAENKPL